MSSVSTAFHKALFRILPASKPTVQLRSVPKPSPSANELIVRVAFAAIQPGDLMWLSGLLKTAPLNEEYAGVSAAGIVEEVGKNIDADKYLGKAVTIYRSLNMQSNNVGTWSEYGRILPSQCAIIPQSAIDAAGKQLASTTTTRPGLALQLFSGTLVNSFTAFAFLKDHVLTGNQQSSAQSIHLLENQTPPGVLITAGTSATGRALLAFCSIYNIPAVVIVRSSSSAESVRLLQSTTRAVEGQGYWLLQSDSSDFTEKLPAMLEKANATVVFDGLGGVITTTILPLLLPGSRVFVYGAVDRSAISLTSYSLVQKRLSIAAFFNFLSPQAVDVTKLQANLHEISSAMEQLPKHFYTAVESIYNADQAEDALKLAASGYATKRYVLDFTNAK